MKACKDIENEKRVNMPSYFSHRSSNKNKWNEEGKKFISNVDKAATTKKHKKIWQILLIYAVYIYIYVKEKRKVMTRIKEKER